MAGRREFLQNLGKNPLAPYGRGLDQYGRPPGEPFSPPASMGGEDPEFDYRNFGFGVQGPAPQSVQYPQFGMIQAVSESLPNVNPVEGTQSSYLPGWPPEGFRQSMPPGTYAPIKGFMGSRGQIVRGNIPLNYRQSLANPGGGYSNITTDSYTIEDPRHAYFGKEVLLPTVVNGARLTRDQAMARFYRTGEHAGIFDTPADANAYATWLHNEQTRRAGIGP
jgi:hypothetical protein